ncbi:MAG: glycosyltransferase, partial [Candidatus Omnitrophota bacterium]
RDLPYPATHGYKKRNYFLIKALSERNIDITLFVENADKDGTEAITHLKSYCKEIKIIKTKRQNKLLTAFFSLFSSLPFSLKLRLSPKTKKTIAQYIKENPQDLIICDAIHRALNLPLYNKAYKILYEHNIESTIIKRYAKLEKNILKKLFAFVEYLKFKKIEEKIWRMFNCVAACSLLDKKIIQERTKGVKVITVNNGVESGYFNPNSYKIEENSLVYTGQIGWHPNEDALIYFVKNIYPLIKKEKPGVKFWIVGDKPSDRIKDLANSDKSIIVTGFVEDIREHMGKAQVFIVPLRIGAGSRLKILEALSMKKAIVTTSIGCEGLEVENNRHLLIRDTTRDFAIAVREILNNPAGYLNLGENGRKLIEEKYDWNAVFNSLDEVLAGIP